METEEVRVVEPMAGTGLQLSAEPQLSALSARYAARGLFKSVMNSATEQIRKEEETRALAPDAYRLSLLSDAAVRGCYRRGKDRMETADLVYYFKETRNRRIKTLDFSENTGIDLCEDLYEDTDPEAPTASVKTRAVTEELRALPVAAGKHIRASLPTWFNSDKPDASRETRRFPLSAFAAVIAVAMSLMLIVASSVLLTRAEQGISNLKSEAEQLSEEVLEMRTDLDVASNLLEIRRIATEEYGMIEEDYLKMQYISLNNEDKVEVYEDEREEGVGLSAILSAIGWK